GIRLDKPTRSSELGAPLAQPAGTHTTHLSILDNEGNRVAATLSVNLPLGSGIVAEGTGILLNNQMDDCSPTPGSSNPYGLSSMTPTFVEWDDKVAILGTPGGSRIISMVLLGVQEALAGKPVTEWVSRPRYHHQYLPDVVEVEPAFIGSEEARSLEVRGHTLKSTGRAYGDMHAVLWEK